jgi:glucose-1-phosphate cytidylyltransferase
MKAVILAGGRGTRIAEESSVRPKPMITIGGQPILLHILRIYAAYGVTDFIICLGYKGYLIKELFANYLLHSADVVEVDIGKGAVSYDHARIDPWRVTLVETGENTQTGGRIRRIRRWVEDDDFFLTYGDGLSDVDLDALLAHHRRHQRYATVTSVTPPGRFGALKLAGEHVAEFVEKPVGDNGQINGGYFVLSPQIFDYIEGDNTVWEHQPLQKLAADGQLSAYRHHGFWQAMDTMRDRDLLEQMWASGRAPWRRGPA